MFPLQNSFVVSKASRFFLLLKYSPACCISQFNGCHPFALHFSSRSHLSHFGSRQLLMQPSRGGLMLIPPVSRLDASHFIAGGFCPFTSGFPHACVHLRRGSHRLFDHPNFCAVECSNLVTSSAEECSLKFRGTVLTAGAKVSSPANFQGGSKVDMPELTLESHVEQPNDIHFEDGRSNESTADGLNKAEECGLSMHRLGKVVENQRQSLEHVRPQLQDQKELTQSTLQVLTASKCQSECRIREEVDSTYSSKHEVRSARTESKERVATKISTGGNYPMLGDVSASNSPAEQRFNEGAHIKSCATFEEDLSRIDFEESVASTVTKSGGSSHEADISMTFRASSWPEWRSFSQHLKRLNFLSEAAEGCNIFDDPTRFKRALYKFSQAHETVLKSLSRKHLQILAGYGCPNNDRRTVAAGKRLRNCFQIEEKRVCNACVLQSSCESAFLKPANIYPKLSDVMRLIYSTVVSDFSRENEVPNNVKSSINYLLREIMIQSGHNYEDGPESETTLDSSMQRMEKVPILDEVGMIEEQRGEVRKFKPVKAMNKGSLNNQGKIETEVGNDAVVTSNKWKCSRCSFVNLQHKDKCTKCGHRQSENDDIILQSHQKTTQKLSDEPFSVEEDMKLSENSSAPLWRMPVDQRLELDSYVLQQTPQKQDGRNGYLSSTAGKDESDVKKIECRNDHDSRTTLLRSCAHEHLATRDKERLKLDSGFLQQTNQEQGGGTGYVSSTAGNDEIEAKKIELGHGSSSDKVFDIFDDIVEAESSTVVPQTKRYSSRKNSLSDLVRKYMDAFYPQRGEDEEGIGCRDNLLSRDSGKFRRTGSGNEEYNVKPRYASQRDDEIDGWGYKESLHRSSRVHDTFDSQDSRHSYDGGRGFQAGGQGAGRFQGVSYSDDSYWHSDRVLRGNRSYKYRGSSEDEWEEKGSRSGRQAEMVSPKGRGRSRH